MPNFGDLLIVNHITETETIVSQPKKDLTIYEIWNLPDDAVVTTVTAAKMLVRSPKTLKKWRTMGEGPAYVRGRPVTYRVGSLKTYNLGLEVNR